MKAKISVLLFTIFILNSCGSSKRVDKSAIDPLPKEKNVIHWRNASFEADLKVDLGKLPAEWGICSDGKNSPPDLFRNGVRNHFNVMMPASEGRTFVGLVARDDGSREHISQELTYPLEADSIHTFQMDLALSSNLMSRVRTTMQVESFNHPLKLQIWASEGLCTQGQLLYETTAIEHHDWQRYTIHFKPDDYYEVITFEVFHDEGISDVPYNGNLMIDNLSSIRLFESNK